MIVPLCTGGNKESAFGDPVETTLTQWAMQCREQNGINIMPHFPDPRAEGASAIVLGLIDGIEMASESDIIYGGMSPYSLSDWYSYLNCGYQLPAAGGTDKMRASVPAGNIRTYSFIKDAPLTYESWKASIQRGNTFATFGPLLDFHVNGCAMGTQHHLPKGGGTVEATWEVASVTFPVTRIELIVNGEIRGEKTVDPAVGSYAGSWSIRMDESGWVALRVRGRYPGKKEAIVAHSSSVMVIVDRKTCLNAADAMIILEQIEGSTAYIKNLGTKAEEKVLKQMLMTLTKAHRALHNRMHQHGIHHRHTVKDDHHHH
jgi:hypothetical protein